MERPIKTGFLNSRAMQALVTKITSENLLQLTHFPSNFSELTTVKFYLASRLFLNAKFTNVYLHLFIAKEM